MRRLGIRAERYAILERLLDKTEVLTYTGTIVASLLRAVRCGSQHRRLPPRRVAATLVKRVYHEEKVNATRIFMWMAILAADACRSRALFGWRGGERECVFGESPQLRVRGHVHYLNVAEKNHNNEQFIYGWIRMSDLDPAEKKAA